jgi:hypothetical protein
VGHQIEQVMYKTSCLNAGLVMMQYVTKLWNAYFRLHQSHEAKETSFLSFFQKAFKRLPWFETRSHICQMLRSTN